MASTVEARLAAIESKLGIFAGKSAATGDNLDKRLDDLKALYEDKTDAAFRESFAESDRLIEELDAGTALTHQTSVSSTPLYYRRQEVLSAADGMKSDFDQLIEILNLLLVSQPPREGGSAPLREEEVTQAPIITTPPASEEHAKRLVELKGNIDDLNSRTQAVAGRVDALLKLHYALIATTSEKLVVADEVVYAKEQAAK
ncbi:expressed unknown protein [Seminavis robusta]|uniref:Uncharacterized protein n=1 Tax=Seminavis robusta TaxID=568900 RepID=A0A9N8EUA5_9STRA|nr:expressed unknown protein [Seminavis robusta]|eukprot:Sro1838_g300830.1 n/a (201) ;mRNA; f:16813-17415